MARSAALYEALSQRFPAQAPYAVALAFRLRYSMQLNVREALHMLELRTGPQGHPSYRRVCQEMHRLIAEQAGHRPVAEMMRFVDHQAYDIERIEAERRADVRRAGDQTRPSTRVLGRAPVHSQAFDVRRHGVAGGPGVDGIGWAERRRPPDGSRRDRTGRGGSGQVRHDHLAAQAPERSGRG